MRKSQRPITGPKRARERGSILFLTLLFLVLINIFAVAFWKLVPVELHSARRQMLETEAYFASDAGVVDSLAFLEQITSDGNIDNYFNTNGVINADGHKVLKRTGTVNSWNWEAEIIPGPETYGNATNPAPNPLRVYEIVAIARRPGMLGSKEQYRKVSAWVRQRSFVENNWGNMATGGDDLWLFMDSFTLGGDYHSNGKGLLRIEDSSFWGNTKPAIAGDFSFSKSTNNPDASLGFVDGVQYSSWGANNVPYFTTGAQKGLPNGNRYSKISGNGRAGVKMKSEIQMPINTDSVAFGVWGATIPTAPLTNTQKIFGSSSTVNVAINGAVPGGPATNGIWIDEADVAQIELRTTTTSTDASDDPSNDNQIMRIFRGTSTTKYVEVEFVTGRDFTIPAGATVLGNTHAPGAVLRPSDNGGKGYTIVRNRDGGTNTYAVYTDQTNGAVYSTGNINGVRGLVKGRRTIGVSTDTGASTTKDKQITIDGDILYAGTTPRRPQDSPNGRPTDSANTLGLIGYAVRLADDGTTTAPTLADPQIGKMYPRRSATTNNNPLYLYCSIFAGRRNDPAIAWTSNNDVTRKGGGFGSKSPDNTSYGHGHMVLYGSITEGIRQWKGTGDVAGNSYQFDLDPNLEEIQPPFFPTLPSYDLLSWQEKSVFSY